MYQRSLEYLVSKKEYMHHLSTLLFIGGFIFDLLVLPDIDDAATRYVGIGYLIAISLLIFFREWIVSRNTADKTEQRIYAVTSYAITSFCGAALSFVFIYALRSAALSVSWPLLAVFLLCMFANEIVSSYNYRFTLDVGMFFLAMLFYLMFNIPVLVKTQNNFIFLISIIISIIISFLFIYILRRLSDTAQDETPRAIALAFGIPMFAAMFYFLNILPAVPLTQNNSGVYHNLYKTEEGEYIGKKEVDNRFFNSYRQEIFHLTPEDDSLYFFSSVKAPANLKAPLSHVWEYYDTNTSKWLVRNTVSFTIVGGRKEGYRSYSKIENPVEGTWRVTVKVDDARIVGQKKFKVIKSTKSEIKLEEKSL